ncbi:PE family protein [Mycobacterium tuberculosis variant bovis]|nr:PE domain-containing protein [Mycobacterium tuberculosis]MCV7273960.1 PE family protein [Mycobacterium tuberculosis variant bovis]
MSFVLIAPEFVTAAAGDLTNLGSSISAANASAASATWLGVRPCRSC